MIKGLMNSTALSPWNQVFRAPPGGAGSGADDDGGQEEEGDFFGEDDVLESDLGEPGLDGGEEISDDSPEFLVRLWEEQGEEEDEDEDEDAGDSPDDVKAMREKIAADIGALSLPEDAIPDDFDPSDRKQLRDLLTRVQKQSVQHAMQIIMQPVGAAFKQTIVRMRQEFKEGVSKRFDETEQRNQLHQMIPISKNKEYSKVVDTILGQAMKRSKGNRTIAIQATRKALRAMGIPPDGRQGSSNRDTTTNGGRPRTAAQRTNDVLDMFAPLPAASDDNGKKLQNRLTRKT